MLDRHRLGQGLSVRGFRRALGGRFAEALILVIVTITTFSGLWRPQSITALADHSVGLYLLCLAQMLVVATGRVDLTLGATKGLAACGFVLFATPLSLPGATLLVLAIATSSAFVWGAMIAQFGANSLAVTLGLLFALEHTLHWFFGYQALSDRNLIQFQAMAGDWRVQVVFAAVLTGALFVVLRFTSLGVWLRAVGSGPKVFEAVRGHSVLASGLAYSIAAGLGAVAGMLEVARLEQAVPSADPESLLFSLAAVILGGIALGGGQLSVWWALRGCIIIGLVKESLNLIGMNIHLRWILLGLAITLAAAFPSAVQRRFWNDSKIV